MTVGWVRIGDFRRIGDFVRRGSSPLCNGNGNFSLAAVSPKRCEIRQRLPLITNRKSNTRFRLIPKSTTLVDPEMTLDSNYALRCMTHMSFGANHENLNEDRPILSAAKM